MGNMAGLQAKNLVSSNNMYDIPVLVITVVPLTKDYSSAIMHTFRMLLTKISIYIKMNIAGHPNSFVAITQVPTLSPQNRLIKKVWIVRY